MKKIKNTFSVRCIIQLPKRGDQKQKYLYEERITLWRTLSIADAIKEAEREAITYIAKDGSKLLDGNQAYWLYESPFLPRNGTEVFSLIRESDLPPRRYVKQFFLTGLERTK